MRMERSGRAGRERKPFGFAAAVLALSAALSAPACARLGAQTDAFGSVVKVFSESVGYDYESPWKLGDQDSGSGSGCIIAGRRILTSAHVVSDAKFIRVQRAGGREKVQARVAFIAHDCDLALLEVDDPAFFDGSRAMDIGPLVSLRDRVTVCGFPEGGEELSLTEGIVSRIEVNTYIHAGTRLLCGQIDAAVNLGNSGGPVMKDGRVAGVAFQTGTGENNSYMVPSPVISHFLKDIADGTYEGIPGLEIAWQPMENTGLRAKFGVPAGRSGVLVNRVFPGSPVDGIVRPGDVLLSIEGNPIAENGTIDFRGRERTSFEYAVQQRFVGDRFSMEVLRGGQVERLSAALTAPVDSTRLVPKAEYEVQPSYFIVGGMVFQRLTGNYVRMWDKSDVPPELRVYYLYGQAAPDRRNVVLLTSVLSDEINAGYEELTDAVIVRANGRKVSTLRDLKEAVEANNALFHVFVDEQGHEIVIDAAKAKERGDIILKRYKVDSDRSADLK